MNVTEHLGVAGVLAKAFIRSRLTPLLILSSLMLGVFAVAKLPREEEPQINVPMFDILVPFPGASAKEVEERVINVGERKLWEIRSRGRRSSSSVSKWARTPRRP